MSQTKTLTRKSRPTVAEAPHGYAPCYYFAYGSNLHMEQMRWRCPTAVPVAAIDLPGWRLEFRGVATIVPGGPEDFVAGAVYRIQPRDEAALDRYEGFNHRDQARGLYRKENAPFTLRGEEHTAMFYVMNRGGLASPSDCYFATIAEGFGHWGLDREPLVRALEEALEADYYARPARWDRTEELSHEAEACASGAQGSLADLFGHADGK